MKFNVIWKIDKKQVKTACKELGVEAKVRFKLESQIKLQRGVEYAGIYWWYPKRHLIELVLPHTVSPGRASEVIWHELTHAAQDERLGRYEFRKQYELEDQYAWNEFNKNPKMSNHERLGLISFEIEAHGNEKNAKDHPLVKI